MEVLIVVGIVFGGLILLVTIMGAIGGVYNKLSQLITDNMITSCLITLILLALLAWGTYLASKPQIFKSANDPSGKISQTMGGVLIGFVLFIVFAIFLHLRSKKK